MISSFFNLKKEFISFSISIVEINAFSGFLISFHTKISLDL